MAKRTARTNELGLVVAPPKLDCVGEHCQTALEIGRCFVSEHHLYFPNSRFDGSELLQNFRDNEFNRVNLPRCRHTQYHQQVSDTEIPDKEVMEQFLHEARILSDLGITTSKILDDERRLEARPRRSESESRLWAQVFLRRGQIEEDLEYKREKQAKLLLAAAGIEIFPRRLLKGDHVVGHIAVKDCRQLLLPA